MALEVQSQTSIAGRSIRLHNKKISWIDLENHIVELIDNGITRTDALALELGKTTKQTRRYLVKIAESGKISLNSKTGRLEKTKAVIVMEQFEKLSQDEFGQIPQISKWISNKENCKPHVARAYKSILKQIFDKMESHPSVALASKDAFIDFWKRFKKQNDDDTGAGHDHQFRIAYRNLGDEFDFHISLTLGRKIGLTSEHDSYKKYAGAALSTELTKKMGKKMLEDGEIELYTWFRTGVRSGARSGGIATMTWDKIVFDENNFEVAQHETKKDKGDNWLGETGAWQIKTPAHDLLLVLKKWKNNNLSPNSKFVWFDDTGSDVQNRKEAVKVRARVIPKLRKYLEMFRDEMDILTREYAEVDPGHLLRHTFAQLLRDEGATNDEIQIAGCWDSAETVAWYTAASKKEKAIIRTKQNKVENFSEEERKLLEGTN